MKHTEQNLNSVSFLALLTCSDSVSQHFQGNFGVSQKLPVSINTLLLSLIEIIMCLGSLIESLSDCCGLSCSIEAILAKHVEIKVKLKIRINYSIKLLGSMARIFYLEESVIVDCFISLFIIYGILRFHPETYIIATLSHYCP